MQSEREKLIGLIEALLAVENPTPRIPNLARDLLAKAAAALSSMEAGAVKVKALEWEEVTCDHFTAQSMLGEYTAIRDEHGCMWWQSPSNAIDADNLDAAKSAAQADFERRILSALEPSPASPVTDEMVEGLVSWLCNDVLPAYEVSTDSARNDPELWESCRTALARLDTEKK